jgi:DNA primase catalytic core
MIHRRTIDSVQQVSIVDVVARTGRIELKKQGKDHWASCPFHNEKSASFSVNEAKGFYKCFGCGAGGNGITFVMKNRNLSYPEAVKVIAGTFNIEVEHDNSDKAVLYAAKAEKTDRAIMVNELALAAWQAVDDPQGNAAMIDRWGDDLAEVAAKWDIAFAPETWDTLRKALTTAQADMPMAEELGLLKRKDAGTQPYDFFRGRIMFPIRDHMGRLIAFGGRYVGNEEMPDGGKPAKYLNSKETAGIYEKSSVLYGIHLAKATISATGRATMVEGYTDVIAMHHHGYTGTVGVCGTAITEQHIRLLKKFGCKHIELGLDGDAAGRKAMEERQTVETILSHGLGVSFLFFPDVEGSDPDNPKKHDPDSFLKKHGSLDAMSTPAWQMPPEQVFIFDETAMAAVQQAGGAALVLTDDEADSLRQQDCDRVLQLRRADIAPKAISHALEMMGAVQATVSDTLLPHTDIIAHMVKAGITVETAAGADALELAFDNIFEDVPTPAAKAAAAKAAIAILEQLDDDSTRKAYADHCRVAHKCPASMYNAATTKARDRFANQEDESPRPLVRRKDAVESRIDMLWLTADTITAKADAERATTALLAHVKDDVSRKMYAEYVKEQYTPSTDIFRKATADHANVAVEDMDEAPTTLPAGVDRHRIMEHGLDMVNDEKNNRFGIYVRSGKQCYPVSNFTMRPLFHIYSMVSDRNKRICVIRNGSDRHTIEVTMKQLLSLMDFNTLMGEKGNFQFDGNPVDLAKLRGYLMPQFPRAVEIFWHGWQPEGFFAFADGVFVPSKGFTRPDENGLTIIDKDYWFLPACSRIFEGRRDDDQDDYQEIRPLTFRKGTADFAAFAQKFMDVFGSDKGAWGLAWTMAVAFRDLIFREINSFFPILYAYGETQSGKSTFCMVLNALWFHNRPPFQLSNGTAPGLATYMANITNSIAWCDEMDYGLDKNIFQQVKNSADGSGRVKRLQSSSRKSNDRDKVNSAVLLSGQYLVTEDTGALINRSILLEFRTTSYTKAQMKQKSELDAMVEEGLSNVLCQLLNCRDLMEKRFADRYRQLNDEMRERMGKKGMDFTNRTMQILMSVVAAVDVMREKVQHPVAHADLMDMAEEKISTMHETVSTTNALSTFWRIMEQQFQRIEGRDDNGAVIRGVNEGTDFLIQEAASGTELILQTGKGKFEKHVMPEGGQILYLRLGNVHGKYLREHKAQFSMNGIGDTDLRSYMKSSDGYIGNVIGVKFGNIRTSAIAFDFERLTSEVTFGTPRRHEAKEMKLEQEEHERKLQADTAAIKPAQPAQTKAEFPNPHTGIDIDKEEGPF